MVSKLRCLVANDRQLDVTASGRDGSQLRTVGILYQVTDDVGG